MINFVDSNIKDIDTNGWKWNLKTEIVAQTIVLVRLIKDYTKPATVHTTDTSRKRSFSKTLFNPEEFENAKFAF